MVKLDQHRISGRIKTGIVKTYFSLLFVSSFVLMQSCAIDRTITDLSQEALSEYQDYLNLDPVSQLVIAEASEPGEPLILCLRFLRKEDQTALTGQQLAFYHTSSSGTYDPVVTGDESTARLSGRTTTDDDGRVFLQTILPGDYGSSADNRHIHSTVFGAKPEAYDIHFLQYTGRMGRRFIRGSDQHFLADLHRMEDGTLIAFLDILVKE